MKGDVVISAITPHDIQSFHNQLMSDKVSPTTINIYMTQLKIIIDFAKKLKMVKYKVDPFEVYKKPQSSIRDLDISVGEVKRIRDLETDIYALKVTKDIFMLSYYLAGMNITDMLDYNFKGKKQVQYVRKKTEHTKTGNNQICFTIQPEAKDIIIRYMKPNGKLEFGKYDTRSKVDNLLHRNMMILASEAKINKHISYYTARKSFAQHGFELGIPLETIEYCIGQSMKRNRPIFNYVKIMSKHADVAIRQILDNLK
jgi:site-specific recombinase XerD